MWKVYFDNGVKEREITNRPCPTRETAEDVIRMFLQDHHYKSYCWNIVPHSMDEIKYDVGSHTQFFYLRRVDPEVKEEMIDVPFSKMKQYMKGSEDE